MNRDKYKMKNLVDISTMVTESTDFFSIKDKIVEKMLEVVHPTKACVNLFYKNNYDHAYLVCSKSLNYVPKVFPSENIRGAKIDFDAYPSYIHEAVKNKKVIYVESIFDDERAEDERDLAELEGYMGRIVFPLIINNTVVGFMTCFLTKEDFISEQDIDFISSVASLIALSIEITNKNNNTQILVNKLRGAIASINQATKRLYQNRDINGFLEHLTKQASNITKSEESLILINDLSNNNKLFNSYNIKKENKSNLYPVLDNILKKDKMGCFSNDIQEEFYGTKIESYIYYKLKNKNEVVGVIVCANSKNYTQDDLNILSILAKQISVAMQLYEYNAKDVKHRVLDNELKVLNNQQKLIMDKGKMELNEKKELYFYHKPAKVVGGDFYYATRIDENTVSYIVADVMGHGIVSNYVVAMLKGAFKALCYQYKTSGDIMTNLNKILYDEFDKMGVFTTCMISIVNTKEDTIDISNAGHYSPIIVKDDGELEGDLNCKKGIPLGVIEDAEYMSNIHRIHNYSMICMYTDGILELKNSEKEEYGIDRFGLFLKNNFRKEQEQIVENLKLELKQFSVKERYDDDILVVMLKDI